MSNGTLKPLRIGVLGAANIARLFITSINGSAKVDVCTIASRNADKATAFAKENGPAQSFGSYEAILADAKIEAGATPAETVDIMLTMDALAASARDGNVVAIAL